MAVNRINKIQSAIVSRVFMSKNDRSKLTELKKQIKNDAREAFAKSESTAPTKSDVKKLVSERLGKHWYHQAVVGDLLDYAKSAGPTQLLHGTMVDTKQAIPDRTTGTDQGKHSKVKLLKSPSLQCGHIELYDTGNLIASGGFGQVYSGSKLSRDGNLEPVAMKTISPENASAGKERTALRAWNDIGSPNLVKYYCSVETRDLKLPFMKQRGHGKDLMLLFMEQCEQRSHDFALKLRSIPEKGMPRVEKEKIMRSLVMQLLQGMAALHQHDFKHLDIKPGNVMLSYDGVLKVIDAGYATQETSIKACHGTAGYIAPELQANQPGIDLKMCDAYSTGITIQELYRSAGLAPEIHKAERVPVFADAKHFLCTEDPSTRMSIDDFLETGLFADTYPPDELTRMLLQHKLISGKPQDAQEAQTAKRSPVTNANQSNAGSIDSNTASVPSQTGATQGSDSSRQDLPDQNLFSSMRGPSRMNGWQSNGYRLGRHTTKTQKDEVDLYSYFRKRANW